MRMREKKTKKDKKNAGSTLHRGKEKKKAKC
jgi:hypothetical protein